jgi:cell volume regulation protein A
VKLAYPAPVPVAAGVQGSDLVLDIVFVLVVGFTLIQAPSLQFMARKLHIGESVGSVDLDVEVSPLGSFGADIVQVSVGAGSQLHGVEVFELRLPPGAVVSLIVRKNQTLVPDPRTAIEHGDELLLVVPAALRERVERRLEAVSRHGRLAGWLDDRPG